MQLETAIKVKAWFEYEGFQATITNYDDVVVEKEGQQWWLTEQTTIGEAIAIIERFE